MTQMKVICQIYAADTAMHTTQIEKAPPADDSPGAVRQPRPEGPEVVAGRLGEHG
jgi:hypothetical protein